MKQLNDRTRRKKKIKEKFEALGFEAEYVLLPFKKTFKGLGTCPFYKSILFQIIRLVSEYPTLFYDRAKESELIQPLILQMESIPTWALIIITLLVVLILHKSYSRPTRIQNPPGENQI